MRPVVVALVIGGLAGTASAEPAGGRSTAPAPAAKRWLAGDFHMHVAPPDAGDDVTAGIPEIVASARAQHLDFVALSPHLWDRQWEERGKAYRRTWTRFAADARAVSSPTLIPGVEWTTRRGHFGVFGVDLGALTDPDLLTAASDANAFISVNHPFAVPTHIPGVTISDYDLSYRVWSEGAAGFTAIDGAEVWNVPLAMANVLVRPGGHSGAERTWLELDRVVHREHRRMVALGGTDNHHGQAMATTWVLAPDASEASILAAVRAGATCVGGPEAGTLHARGEGGERVEIGGAVRGARVTLDWVGKARLFVDGVDRGEHDGGFTHETGGALHTYRIAIGDSQCGFVYANL